MNSVWGGWEAGEPQNIELINVELRRVESPSRWYLNRSLRFGTLRFARHAFGRDDLDGSGLGLTFFRG